MEYSLTNVWELRQYIFLRYERTTGFKAPVFIFSKQSPLLKLILFIFCSFMFNSSRSLLLIATHRVSLVQELEGRDPHYVSARINDVLNTLPPDERQNVLANYTQKAPQVKDKTSFMVNLIDALFDRKHKAQQQPQVPARLLVFL